MSAVVERPEARVIAIDEVRALESAMKQMPGQVPIEQLTKHHFCEGVYCREFFLPAGVVAVGKQHSKESFFLMVSGEATITTADGTLRRIRAPFMAVTQPGSKRIVAAHEDTTFLTFHPNPSNERDLVELENIFIIPEALPAPDGKELLE